VFPKAIFSELVSEVKKLGSDALEDNVETLRDRASFQGQEIASVSPAMDFNMSTTAKKPLSSIIDPLTREAVEPPPYAQVMEVLDAMIDNNFDEKISPRLTKEEIIDIRFLSYYFPRRLHLCCTPEGQKTILKIAVIRSIVAGILFGLSFWLVR
jgi:hypothetical protein